MWTLEVLPRRVVIVPSATGGVGRVPIGQSSQQAQRPGGMSRMPARQRGPSPFLRCFAPAASRFHRVCRLCGERPGYIWSPGEAKWRG